MRGEGKRLEVNKIQHFLREVALIVYCKSFLKQYLNVPFRDNVSLDADRL